MQYGISILLSGISLGGQYALIAIGYTMVYGILRLINFAHGDVFMVAGLMMVYLSASLPLPAMVRAAGFCLIPIWVTGGIHLDGYADTCDALCSYGDTQKKLDILKDPHCGAFAVIRLCSYFVAYFALCCCVQFTPQVGAVWLLALVLERACSGYAVAAFPLAKNTGLAHTFATAADRTTVRRVLGCLSIVLAVALFALGGGVLVLAAGVALWRYHRVAVKQFGGITGDLAGWFLQKAELYMLAALVFCQWKGFL